MKLLPYVIVLIVPVLGRMSDSDDAVRAVATHTFASLVKMIPLEVSVCGQPSRASLIPSALRPVCRTLLTSRKSSCSAARPTAAS